MVFAYGPNVSHVARGALEAGMARENVHIFETSETLAQLLAEQTQAGDVILFKASHGMHLDRVVDAFLTLKK
jgi:UDP-N-acetylmuramoyl-tripeptide--D-alanyl-D-alanine ligase